MAAQTRQLADLLAGSGAQVEIVQTNLAYRPTWVARVPMLRACFRLLPYLWQLWHACGRAQLVHVMANSGWAWHLFATPAVWIAQARGAPVVVNYRGGEAREFLARSAGLVRWTMARAAALVVPSGFLEHVFADHRMPAAVVPNIVDLTRFRPAQQEPVGGLHIVVARNLERLYDNATALRAFALVHARLPAAHMTIAGTGPESASLQALAVALGIRHAVHFAGRLDREQMAELYRRAGIALNPSLVDNMPNSVLEAMASGVAVVSTDVGGVPYIVRHGVSALLVPAADPQAMAQALLQLGNDTALRVRLATQARSDVRAYTWERVAPLLAAVYRQARSTQRR